MFSSHSTTLTGSHRKPSTTPRPSISRRQFLGVLTAHVVVFVVLLILLVLTIQHNGFARAPTTKNDFLDSVGMEWSILWQSLPPFMISLFAWCRNWLVDEAIYHISQADIEKTTRDPSPSPAEITERSCEAVSLLGPSQTPPKPPSNEPFNYLSTPSPLRSYRAFQSRDFNLLLALLLSLLVTFILQPLIASLIAPYPSTFTTSLPIHYPSLFNPSRLASLPPATWSLISDSATAETLHSGTPTPWTNTTHAFLPFSLPPSSSSSSSPAGKNTLTAPSTAYSAHLSCLPLPPDAFTFSLDDLGTKDGFYHATLVASDRNCSIKHAFVWAPVVRPLVIETFYQGTCGLANGITRLVLMVVESEVTNRTGAFGGTVSVKHAGVVGCLSGYVAAPGEVSVSWAGGAGGGEEEDDDEASSVVRFVADAAAAAAAQTVKPTKDFSHEGFETTLLGLEERQTKGREEQVAWTWFTQFAMGIVDKRGNGSVTASEMVRDPGILQEVLPLAFTTVYRVAVARAGLVPVTGGGGESVMGRLETVETRLWVRYWLVVLLAAYLGISAGSSAWLWRCWWGWDLQVGEKKDIPHGQTGTGIKI